MGGKGSAFTRRMKWGWHVFPGSCLGTTGPNLGGRWKSNLFLSFIATWDAKQHVMADNINKHLKDVAACLNYTHAKESPLVQVNTYLLWSGGANALALLGYLDTQIKKGTIPSTTFKEYTLDLGRICLFCTRDVARNATEIQIFQCYGGCLWQHHCRNVTNRFWTHCVCSWWQTTGLHRWVNYCNPWVTWQDLQNIGTCCLVWQCLLCTACLVHVSIIHQHSNVGRVLKVDDLGQRGLLRLDLILVNPA